MEAAVLNDIEPTISLDEFTRLYAGTEGRHEWVRGRVVEMPPPGHEHGSLDSVLAGALGGYVRQHRLGKHYVNTGFLIQPDILRGPDQAFISTKRLTENPPPTRGYWATVPDLAVEIVSPDDRADEINQKVREYLEAGVRLVWLVYPRQRQVHVYRASGDVQILFGDATLTGEDVVPGFEIPLSEIWV
jgi:Uma2 family endonuclease